MYKLEVYMTDLTPNEMNFVLIILKSPEKDCNANNIAEVLGISSMGALKIARKLEKEGVLVHRQSGRIKFYRINFSNDYAKQYVKFLLKREAEQSPPVIKRWVNDLKKLKSADLIVLFGSVLEKGEKARDIDVLLVTDQKNFDKLKKEVDEVNFINVKKIHPVYQARIDLEKNLKKEDKIVINAIKGVVVAGEDLFMEVLQK